MSKHTVAVISLVFVMLVWGSSFPITKMAVAELPPVLFAFLRFTVASIILLAIFLIKGKKTGPKFPFLTIVLMGLSGITFYYIFFNFSLKYTSASIGALLQGFIPVIIALMAAIFLKEKLSFRQLAGILISIVGVIFVGFIAAPPGNASNPLVGNLLMIVSIFSWAIYTILSKKVAALDPVIVITFLTWAGTLFLVPAVLFELKDQPWPRPSLSAWMAVIYLGAAASALGYILYNSALEHLSAAQVGNFLNLDPVVGALLAFFFLHEKILFWQVAGSVLVLIGVWLSAGSNKAKE